MNDPGELNITYTIGGMKIPHALYDLGSSINVMPLSKFKELEIGENVPRNMTLTLVNSFVTRPIGIVQDVIVHVDGLTFPADFVVIDVKNDSERGLDHNESNWQLEGKGREKNQCACTQTSDTSHGKV